MILNYSFTFHANNVKAKLRMGIFPLVQTM